MRLRAMIGKSRRLSLRAKLYLLKLDDHALRQLDAVCRRLPGATAAAIMAQVPRLVSYDRVCLYLIYLGRSLGEGRTLHRERAPREPEQACEQVDAIPPRVLRLLEQEPGERRERAIASWHKLLREEQGA